MCSLRVNPFGGQCTPASILTSPRLRQQPWEVRTEVSSVNAYALRSVSGVSANVALLQGWNELK
jgi:hypothetical protein